MPLMSRGILLEKKSNASIMRISAKSDRIFSESRDDQIRLRHCYGKVKQVYQYHIRHFKNAVFIADKADQIESKYC